MNFMDDDACEKRSSTPSKILRKQTGKKNQILTSQQILQKLPIALTQIKAINAPKNLLN